MTRVSKTGNKQLEMELDLFSNKTLLISIFLYRLSLFIPLHFFCRVKGVDRLRIVDASVMPTHVSGDHYAPLVMIAEKAADMIKSIYRKIPLKKSKPR